MLICGEIGNRWLFWRGVIKIMDKEEKKRLKAQYKQNEQDKIRSSIPMSIGELRDLLSFLDRDDAPDCDHTLKEAIEFTESRNLDPNVVVP